MMKKSWGTKKLPLTESVIGTSNGSVLCKLLLSPSLLVKQFKVRWNKEENLLWSSSSTMCDLREIPWRKQMSSRRFAKSLFLSVYKWGGKTYHQRTRGARCKSCGCLNVQHTKECTRTLWHTCISGSHESFWDRLRISYSSLQRSSFVCSSHEILSLRPWKLKSCYYDSYCYWMSFTI